MISSFLIACLSFIGMILSFLKLPLVVQYFLKKYHLATDLLVFIFTYLTITAISKTIVGLLSATLIAFMADMAIRFLKLADEDPDINYKLNRRITGTRNLVINLIRKYL